MRANDTTRSNRVLDAEKAVGVVEVMTVGVRVAGRVPTRTDLRFAGTPEQMLGLSLGTVLIYLNSHLAVRSVALAWGQAAPMARSLSPALPAPRRPVMATGPWSLTTMIRMFGTPSVDTLLLAAQPGTNPPTMLRIQVGPITCVGVWVCCDAARRTSTGSLAMSRRRGGALGRRRSPRSRTSSQSKVDRSTGCKWTMSKAA